MTRYVENPKQTNQIADPPASIKAQMLMLIDVFLMMAYVCRVPLAYFNDYFSSFNMTVAVIAGAPILWIIYNSVALKYHPYPVRSRLYKFSFIPDVLTILGLLFFGAIFLLMIMNCTGNCGIT